MNAIIATNAVQQIALNKLVPSKANVRRTGRGERIEELAASIAAHGLLQNLTVRATDDEKFEVVAGGRRLAALKLLAKQKRWAKDAPIPCHLIDGENLTEISLAENALQCPMHPADQFEAFAALKAQDMSVEDIAARFGVSPHTVAQRLKLGAVSPKLMAAYREGELGLEQLSAFAITDDHKLQLRVWNELGGERSRAAILRALNEDKVSSEDRRALFVGAAAYVEAGGEILRDLFDSEDAGFFTNAELLNRLVTEKLTAQAGEIAKEGWKWVEVMPEFDYARTSGMRRVYPEDRPLTEEEEARIEALTERYNALCDSDEETEGLDETLKAIDAEIDALRGEERFRPEDIAIAGVFVCLGRNGQPRIERGLIEAEDDPRAGAAGADDEGEDDAVQPLTPKSDMPEKLVAELTAHRTAALANELAQQPGLALVTVTHALAAETFFGRSCGVSCCEVSGKRAYLRAFAPGIDESRAITAIEARHAEWQKRMPQNPGELWGFVSGLSDDERAGLLAHCVSLTLDAVRAPKSTGANAAAADSVAAALGLDMTAYWQPTAASYFGRLAKPAMLKVIREAVSPEAAQTMEGLKKPDMAARAEKLMAGRNWLPDVLR